MHPARTTPSPKSGILKTAAPSASTGATFEDSGSTLHSPGAEFQLGLVGAAIAVTAWGASGVIAKVITMGALAIAVYRFAFYSIVVGGIRALRRQPLRAAAFRSSLLGGLFLATDVALFFTAVKVTTVVNATIIGAMQPLLLTAYGVRFLGEKVTRREKVLGLAALISVIVIVAAGTSSGGGDLLGDLAAVGALFFWSAYFVEAKRATAVVTPADFTLSASIIVALALAPMAIIFGQSLAWPSITNALWLMGLALGAGFLGHNLMNWSIGRIPLWLSSTFTLLVPVLSSALAWAFLDEPLNAIQVLAMTTAVAALAALVLSQHDTDDHPEAEISQAVGSGHWFKPARRRLT